MLSTSLKVVQHLALLYLLIAVLYTTYLLCSTPFSVWNAFLSCTHFAQELSFGSPPGSTAHLNFDDRLWAAFNSSGGPHAADSGTILAWPPSLSSFDSSVSLSRDTLLSKAFAQSLHPTKVIPYHYRASAEVDPNDVTITTLVTRNRFKVLKELVTRYQGPISVTIHVPLPIEGISALPNDHPSLRTLRELDELYHSSPHFSTYVDVHLACSPFSQSIREIGKSVSPNDVKAKDEGEGVGGRQFNVWRNVARLFARTDFVMMLDVDFAVCTDWRTEVRNSLRKLDGQALGDYSDTFLDPRPNWPQALNETAKLEAYQRLRDGSAALVIPVFEYTNQEDGVDQRTFPRDKETLLGLVLGTEPKMSSFHASWAAGHNSTNYARFYSIPPGENEIYPVTQYQSAYEPYVIMSKRVPWCDERFIGYGANKAACLFEMYLSGVSFFVISDHFLIHQSHKYEEQARREERKHNRKLYTDFKEEVCLRFHSTGTLNSSKAMNAREECKKVKNVQKIASELFVVQF